MKNRQLILLGLVLAVLCAAVLLVCGRSYELQIADIGAYEGEPEIRVEDPSVVRIADIRAEDGQLRILLEAEGTGRTFVDVLWPDDTGRTEVIYVLPPGIITAGQLFGDCTGAFILPVSAVIFLAALLWTRIRRHRIEVGISLYRYRNARNFGLILYLAFLLILQILTIFSSGGAYGMTNTLLGSASLFTYVALPVAFLVSLFVSVQSIVLMHREGISWRNMLAVILGVLICILSVAPTFLSDYLQAAEWINVHNMRGPGYFLELALENLVFAAVAYLECVLVGTIVYTVRAARHIPSFDQDYILILGSRIRADGTLTPLLKGRADRAMEFARMQKEATGKDIVFVPSGGQGPDERISEAAAIREYLLSHGVAQDKILTEDRSLNTEDNLKFSRALIRDHSGCDAPKTAFSTTGYHVLRAGAIAERLGFRTEGIGSGTKRYFWINAFIREFIAGLAAEWKIHLKIVAVLVLSVLGMVLIVWGGNQF